MGSGIGLYGGDPIGSKALTDLGIEAVRPSTGQVVGAEFGQGLAANVTPRTFRAAGRFASETGVVGVDDFGRPIEVAPDQKIEADVANAEFGIPGVLRFSGPTTREAARDLYEHHRDELLRQDVINRSEGGIVQGALGIGANLAAGLLDPLNLAVGFIPIAGEARVGQLLGRAAGRIGEAAVPAAAEAAPSIAARVGERFGLATPEVPLGPLGTIPATALGGATEQAAAGAARFATGAATATEGEAALAAMTAPQRALLRGGLGGAQGAVQMAALQPLEYALSKGEQEDYTMADALRSIALGTVIGGGMHATIGAGIDRLTGRYRNPVSQALEDAGPDARNGLLQGSLGQTIDGKDVNVKPALDLIPNPMRFGEALDEPQPGVSRYPLMRDDIRVGTADIGIVENGKTAMANIVDGPRQLGLPEIRSLARQFFESNPEVDTIRGFRAGREVGALTREDLMRPVEAAPGVRAPGGAAPITAADGGLIGAWHDVPLEVRDLLADVLEGKLKRTGTLAARDIPVDIANQIGTGSFQAINQAFAEDPARAIQILRHIGEDNNQGAGPTAAASFDPLVLHRQGELTAARAQEIANLPPEQLQAAGADPEMWKVAADNLAKAEGSREGGVSVVADQMQYMPADGVPKTASEREAVAVISRALDAEAARGGDLAAFRAEADAAYRAAGHGEPPDIRAAEALQRAPLEGGIAGAEYRKLTAAGVPEEEARTQADLTQRRYEARAARSPSGETAEQLYRREGEDVVRGQAGELAEGELGQAPNETKGHPEGDAEDAAWRKIEPDKTADGKYRGAPPDVTTSRKLAGLRRLIRQLIDEGASGRFWYEHSAQRILQLTRGNIPEAEKITGLLAIYSPQTSVFTNTGFAIKAFEQWKRGEPINVKTGSQDTRAQAWLDRGEDWGGRKTNSFYLNLMHEIITEHPEAVASLNLPADVLSEIRRATVDLWVLRALGYRVDAAGGAMEGGNSKYGFSEREIQRAAGYLNENLQPGERRWLPHQVQAALWSAIKARYEIKAVKDATVAESVRRGFSRYAKGEDGVERWEAPGKNGPERAGHMAVWRKHALAAAPEEVARMVESARGSFGDAIDRIAQNVTAEAVPTASLGHAINNASPEAKRQFTHDALSLLIDDDGNDVLAAQLGVNLNFNHIGAGLFEGNINPTVVTTLVPEKPPGFFDATKARQYARAWQYIFKQDAVPIFRAEQQYDFKGDYSALNPAGRVVKKFDTQRAAQAHADARPGWSIKGGDLSLGAHLEFAQDLDEAALRRLADGLQQELGPDAGFTKTGPRDVSVVNYRGENGLPFIDDVDFGDAIDRIVAREELGVSNVSNFGSEGEYGPVHDWQRDPSGGALAQAAGGSPALQSWMADRAAAFDALLDKWRDPAAANAAAIAERDRIAGTTAEPRPGGEPGTEPGGGPSTTGPPELEQAGRAKVRLSTETERALITLYEGASDASSLIHEKFHIYVDQLFKDAALENASPQLVQDAATLRREVGAKEGEPLTTEQLEQLATWGEQYAREGKAPTPELTGVFERFKQWMMDIYEDIKSLGIPINDDVRGVFDRMFTTPEQEARVAGQRATGNLVGQPVPNMAAHRVATAGGQSVEVTPVVVEARDLIASNDAGYDPALQPRQRDRAASQQQVREIASRLDPERLGMSAEADRGAPIVGDDRMVESGNGRVMAIRAAYAEDGAAAAAYRDFLTRQGIDIGGFDQPVLVRQRTTPMNPQERASFAVDANRAATLQLSAPERAMADARNLTPDMLDLVRNPDNLEAAGNRDFVRAFVQSLPQAEQGAMSTAEGGLSAEGLTRVRHAILARAYGGTPEGAAILSRIAETTQDEIRSISNALTGASPQWARLRADIEAGRTVPEMDLTPELLEAVRRTADLRNRGQTFADFLRQQDAFDILPPRVEAFMSLFYDAKGTRAAGAARIAEELKEYAIEANKVSAERGLDLGLPAVTADDLQRRIVERTRGGGAAADLFDRARADLGAGGAGAGEGGTAAGAEVRRPGAGQPGAGTGTAGEPGVGREAVGAGRERPAPSTEPTGRLAGEPRPTDTLTEIEQHATELEQMQQRLLPEEKLSAESRDEIQAAREAVTEAEGQASALERAALCIMRG
jgi:hypothetical protein